MGSRDQNPEWERLKEVLPDFDSWLKTHDGSYNLRRWIDTGRSGSPVGVVTRYERPDPPLQLIMRIGAEGVDEDAAADEVRRIRQAWRLSPVDFRQAHLAVIEGDPIRLAGRYLIFQRIAGGDLDTWRPLAERVESDSFADTCANITVSVVDDWNPDFPHDPVMRTPAGFLRDLLGDRLDTRSELIQSAARAGIDTRTEWIVGSSQGSRPLPNPLRLATDDGMAGLRRLPIVRGRAHGDLNVYNILLPKKWDRYRLVDLGEFDTAAPLARDPMHLLLSIAAKWIATIDQGLVGPDLAKAIVPIRNHRPPERVGRFAKVSQTLHRALQEYAGRRGYGDLWAEQSLLALIAAALRFAGRDVPNTDTEGARRWFFYLAAVATSEFLDLWHANEDHSNVIPIRPIPGDVEPAPAVGVRDDATLFLCSLADELSRQMPDPETEASMVISTHMLRELLGNIPAVQPLLNVDAIGMAENLRRALAAAVRSDATYADREHAVKIHGWLREMLANLR